MPDREKVYKAWECCQPFIRKCFECPYEADCYHDGFDRVAIADAVSLLKQQEPRVLSKREAYDLPDETDVWCEQRDSKRVVAMTTLCRKYFMLRPTFSMGLESNDIRFWTARPTDEQRKAVPWEGEQE